MRGGKQQGGGGYAHNQAAPANQALPDDAAKDEFFSECRPQSQHNNGHEERDAGNLSLKEFQ